MLLATDPDREGESISWHLTRGAQAEGAGPAHRVPRDHRRSGQRGASPTPATVNESLVRAQESRRILDRLYGYTLSPVLWKKVQTGLSAGRVQSVAVRLIVEREEARRAFRTGDLLGPRSAAHAARAASSRPRSSRVGDQRVATGKDFDAATGALKNRGRAAARRSATRRRSPRRFARNAAVDASPRVDEKPGVERPAPPFTTSTLTQEASRKLGFSTERTMQIAQRLFQGIEIGNGEMEGLITYHRTDSTTLSEKALNESARVIRDMFGAEYYDGPRRYQTKVKNAQEAHEAIRPTDFRLAPQQLAGVLDSDELRLYELIWKRTMASQMVDARVQRTTLEITATTGDGEPAVFTASGKAIEFAGFRRAYVEGSDDPQAELEDQETILPACARRRSGHRSADASRREVSQLLGIEPKRHETLPPARFTEAALIKELEAGGHRPAVHLRLRSSRRSSAAATCSGRARRSSRASRRLR